MIKSKLFKDLAIWFLGGTLIATQVNDLLPCEEITNNPFILILGVLGFVYPLVMRFVKQ
jgi:hypothetical protein